MFVQALLSLHPLSSHVLHDTALISNSVRTWFRRSFSERSEIEQHASSPEFARNLAPCASGEISVSIIVNVNRMAGNGKRPARI